MTNFKTQLEAAIDEKATEWCIEKGVYNKEHFAFQAGSHFLAAYLLKAISFISEYSICQCQSKDEEVIKVHQQLRCKACSLLVAITKGLGEVE